MNCIVSTVLYQPEYWACSYDYLSGCHGRCPGSVPDYRWTKW